MSRLPLGVQTFRDIRLQNQIYVDKTGYVHQLATGPKYIFLSRPRRFGKSLLISTLDSYFRGHRELFEGLKIAELETEWRQHPVIRIDFSNTNYRKDGELDRSIRSMLANIAREYNAPWTDNSALPLNRLFADILDHIYTTLGPVVILIDEYDKPLVNVLDDMTIFWRNQSVLAQLYSVLKGNDTKIRFGMLTGVSQFAKLNIFSGLNNLLDISLDRNYANLTGFSGDELTAYFSDYLESFRAQTGLPKDVFREEFRIMYNGYSWNGQDFLYNPFTVLNAFHFNAFRDHWYRTGVTTFLTQLIRHHKIIPEDIAPHETSDLVGQSDDPTRIPLAVLLFQTGYLTIKEYRYEFGYESYVLDYPNREVRNAFFQNILDEFAFQSSDPYGAIARDVRQSLRRGNADQLFAALTRLFAGIPARLHLPYEAYYHSMVYLFLRLIGFRVQLEQETSKGRIDGLLETAERTFIIEFKFAKKGKPETLSKNAIAQIRERAYFEAHRQSARELVLLGVGVVHKALHGRWEVV